MFGFIEDLVTWFVSFIALVVVTATFGVGFGLIHPMAGIAAGALVMIIAGCMLGGWRRNVRVNRIVREKHGDNASPEQRALVAKEVREREADQARKAAYVANHIRQRQQQLYRPFRR